MDGEGKGGMDGGKRKGLVNVRMPSSGFDKRPPLLEGARKGRAEGVGMSRKRMLHAWAMNS